MNIKNLLESLNDSFDLKLNQPQIEKLKTFASDFKKYNEKINLMSKNDIELFFEKHIFDCLAFNLFNKKFISNQTKNVLDIGSGGGLPAIVLAIVFENLKIEAVDSVAKKTSFISEEILNLDLKNLHTTCSRIEKLPIQYRENFDIITSRALSSLDILLEYSIPYLKKDGFLAAYKALNVEKEISKAKNAFHILNCKMVEKLDYELNLKTNFTRSILVIQKQAKTSSKYPRSYNKIKTAPL